MGPTCPQNEEVQASDLGLSSPTTAYALTPVLTCHCLACPVAEPLTTLTYTERCAHL